MSHVQVSFSGLGSKARNQESSSAVTQRVPELTWHLVPRLINMITGSGTVPDTSIRFQIRRFPKILRWRGGFSFVTIAVAESASKRCPSSLARACLVPIAFPRNYE
jgi:hypothetical protein